jgi:hypothetical protein
LVFSAQLEAVSGLAEASIMKSKQAILNDWGYRLLQLDDLTRLMNSAGSDKGFGLLGRHYYTRVYDKLLAPLRNQAITFVEIGLLRPDRDKRRVSNASEGAARSAASSAPSLQAWREYFPKAKIIGFDIDDFSAVEIPGVIILQGDMSNPADLAKITEAAEGRIDVLIDDGSHVSHHQQIAFANLFPSIASNGFYFIEDCHWQDARFERADAIKTKDMFAAFRRGEGLRSPFVDLGRCDQLAASIASISFYDSIERGVDDTEDALCVIRKA